MHDQLIALSKPLLLAVAMPKIPKELQRRCWGCRTGAKLKAKRRKHKPSVPAILMGNVRSLVRSDRDVIQSGKKEGGGIAVYVNERWCNSDHVCVKECFCCSDYIF